MADYTKAELLNEVSKVFRASLEPGREGGTLNTSVEYQQLLEMASITFLLKPDSVFYLARLAANRLNGILLQEVAVLEDMLVALDDLSQLGKPVRDATTLSNARTTVLTLDAAQSVTNRPETARFSRQMDVFANQLRTNLVSMERGGQFARPREEARDIIQANLVSLDDLHTQLLDQVYALKYALSDFLSLDLPSRVSATVLTTISDRLQSTVNELESATDPENLAASRRLFLETLANKVSVQVLSTFTDPTEFKFRGPSNPIPSTMKHLGQVVGQGTAASVLTSAGPWTLPVSAPLVLSVSGAAPVTVPLNDILGAVLNCRNSESYAISASKRNLHVLVDENVYESTVIGSDGADVTVNPTVRLGFKHLGAVVSFPDAAIATPQDLQVRYIADLSSLQSAAALDISFADPVLTVAAWSPDDEPALGLLPVHLGGYIQDASLQKFEITKIVDANHCWIDTRGLIPNWSSLTLCGQLASGASTYFYVTPNLASAPLPGDRVRVGPTIKTALLSAGGRSTADLISDIEAEAGVFTAGQEGAKLNWHVRPVLVSGDSTRLGLQIRSKVNPTIQVAGRFLKPQDPVGLLSIVEESAHQVLGLLEGEVDTTNLLTPEELAAKISEFSGLVAEVVETTIAAGLVSTVAGTADVDADQDVEAQGVAVYDQILIGEGTAAGIYRVGAVSGTTMGLSMASPFTASETSLAYRVFRQQVKISIASAGPYSSLAVASAPAELGLTVGTVYSAIPTFEAVDKLGNKLNFTGVVAGDLLRIVGQSEVAISEVVGTTTLVLATGLSSAIVGVGFTIRSAAALEYTRLNEGLMTFTTSANLLKKDGFDQNVQAIDNACTAAILPGQNFTSSRNQAKRMVSDLASILTATLLRSSEYTTTVATNANNLSDLLAAYDASQITEVDDLIEAFQDRKYDRALTLLRGCRFSEFYATTDETGSFGGAVMAASRTVVKDLPPASRTRFDYLNQRDLATSTHDGADGETDFSDTENEPEDSGL